MTEEPQAEQPKRSGNNLVHDLRKQLKALQRMNQAAQLRINELETGGASAQHAVDVMSGSLDGSAPRPGHAEVAEVLDQYGVDPRYARFYTSDDTSEEAVSEWIQSSGDLLGVAEPEIDPGVADAVRSISNAADNAPQQKIGSMQNGFDLIVNAKTPAELQAAYRAAGIRSEQ
jgi:hypothetical protein